MEIQTRVALTDIRDDLEVYALLFGFLGYGFWLVPEELFVPGPSLVTVDVFDRTHLLDLFLSLCADGSETSTFWLVQSRRRPEKWTRDPEGGLTRQRKRQDPSFLIMCCVWETPSQVDGAGLLHRAARARHRQAL